MYSASMYYGEVYSRALEGSMLTPYSYQAVANGLHTDHPIPDLPFVDDTHIPLNDPAAVEAVGRNVADDMWGREDRLPHYGGWVAFTTDPLRHDLGWLVRWHPEHGRSVILYRDGVVASAYTAFNGPGLLFRAGGYWWDGAAWYRPAQVWDAAGEEHYQRPVPAAVTITAADLLDAGDGDPSRGQVLEIGQVDPETPSAGRWLDDLALWAERHPSDHPLAHSIVKLTAPELTGDQLVGAADVAQIAGIAASTLRAYISRGEADVPLPQATLSGRSVWSRPVAEDWAEQRQRSAAGVSAAVSVEHSGVAVAPGIAEIWSRFTRVFFAYLWDRPSLRRRWALRWRNEKAVRDIAESLGWEVAGSVDSLIPVYDLGTTVQHAVLDEFARGQHDQRQTGGKALRVASVPASNDAVFYGITPQVTRMLDWLIRHHPDSARHTFGGIVGAAEQRLRIPREVSEQSLSTALSMDGKLDDDTLEEFLSRVLTPDH
jgi:hypothetical protein